MGSKRFERVSPGIVVENEDDFSKMIFLSKEAEKRWNDAPENIRKTCLSLLKSQAFKIQEQLCDETKLNNDVWINANYIVPPDFHDVWVMNGKIKKKAYWDSQNRLWIESGKKEYGRRLKNISCWKIIEEGTLYFDEEGNLNANASYDEPD